MESRREKNNKRGKQNNAPGRRMAKDRGLWVESWKTGVVKMGKYPIYRVNIGEKRNRHINKCREELKGKITKVIQEEACEVMEKKVKPHGYLQNFLVTLKSKMLNNDMVVPSGSGVYAVYDSNGDMQFLGLSRNNQSSVVFHKKSVPHLCASVKTANALNVFLLDSFKMDLAFDLSLSALLGENIYNFGELLAHPIHNYNFAEELLISRQLWMRYVICDLKKIQICDLCNQILDSKNTVNSNDNYATPSRNFDSVTVAT
ncbi:CAX-interacting protein 2 [Artemisia annua]|uniref:CAX-interacting protein 2 n=1 Tax=Artemisia annua TaxID=35608 RepID=A0A2U1KY46_ARTAN|nr:CAX-interacting protein 2 [Artemisia annua]